MPVSTSLVVIVASSLLLFDPVEGRFRLTWDASDELGNRFSATMFFDITDSPNAINDAIMESAKNMFNTLFDAGYGPSTPVRLFGGVTL